MSTKGFLTKWAVITALVALAYVSQQALVSQAAPVPTVIPETADQYTYKQSRRRQLAEEEEQQKQWEQEQFINQNQSHETDTHRTQKPRPTRTPDTLQKPTRGAGRKDSSIQPIVDQGVPERESPASTQPAIRDREQPWTFRDLEQLRRLGLRAAMAKSNNRMKNKKITTLQPPGHWKGNVLYTKDHAIKFENLTAEQKAQALQDLKLGRLKITKSE